MCEQFVGTWKLLSSENFEEYMKELGEKCYFNFLYLEQGRNANFELDLLFLAVLFIKGGWIHYFDQVVLNWRTRLFQLLVLNSYKAEKLWLIGIISGKPSLGMPY